MPSAQQQPSASTTSQNHPTTTTPQQMPPPPIPLTIIVATTTTNGIGLSNHLPWPRLHHELRYFTRITRRRPLTHVSPGNAVIMGRRTWESIPADNRPLRDRINIVVSSTLALSPPSINPDADTRPADAEAIILPTLPLALSHLHALNPPHAFIIGGAALYAAALALPQTRRVLLTRVQGSWDCDVFFPLEMDGAEAAGLGWRRRSEGERRAVVGEGWVVDEGVVDGEGWVKEGEVEYQFCMYEREGEWDGV